MTVCVVIPADPGSGSRAGAGIQGDGGSTLLITRYTSLVSVFRPWTLELDPKNPKFIQSIPSVGHYLATIE